jgi:outer membrane lipoprotein SlyB
MRNTLILIAIATFSVGNSLSAGDGWGSKQTSRTIGGVLGGATVGGVIGHQHGKQKEGIIIGSVLGMIIGNQSGKSKDIREERQRQEQIAREQAHQRELQRRELERQRQYRMQQTRNNIPVNRGGSIGSPSDELTQARHRAEQREAELHREMEILRIQQERRRAMEEYRQREIQAQQQLERIRNGESVQIQSSRYSNNPTY